MNNDWVERERKLFEANAVEHGYNVQRSKRTSTLPIDDYANSNTGSMWLGWLAAKQSMVSRDSESLQVTPNPYAVTPPSWYC
jgi:hypothetical protein